MPAPEPDPKWDPFNINPNPGGDDFFGLRNIPDKVEMTDKFQWVTNGWNCPVCQVMSNRVYEYAFWVSTVTPGFHPGCDCRLVKVKNDIPESNRDLFGVDVLTFHLDHRWPAEYNWNQVQELAEEFMYLYIERHGDGIIQNPKTKEVEPIFKKIAGCYQTKPDQWGFTWHCWIRLFQTPSFMAKSASLGYETLAKGIAGNMSNLFKQNKARKPRAYSPWEIYQGPLTFSERAYVRGAR